MDRIGNESTDRPNRPPGVFSWSLYLFGMVVTSMTFALFIQFFVGPGWGDRFFRGWIDPSFNLFAIPLLGATLGFVVMATANVSYVLARRWSRP